MDYGQFRDLVGQSLKRKEDWLAGRRAEDLEEQREAYEDIGFEMLPDHECSWVTAMWREIAGDDPDPAFLFGKLVGQHPEFDVELIELAAASGIGWRNLRDLVIYADGRCLDRDVEKRRLDAAERGRPASGV